MFKQAKISRRTYLRARMKWPLLGAIFLFLCGAPVSLAQCNYTSVSATINVTADLVPSPPGNPICGGQPFSGHLGPAQTNSSGAFTMLVPPNASITPSSTQWKFTVSITPGVPPPFGTGPQAFTVSATVSGATQNLTSTISAAATALTIPFGSGSSTFATLLGGTNTSAAMTVGTGASLGTSGSGTIAATSLSAASALPNGTTATTQGSGDSSTKIATDAFVMENQQAFGGITNTGPLPLVLNGNFESDNTLPPPGWSVGSNGTVTYETAAPYEGLQTLKMVANTNPAGQDVLASNTTDAVPGDIFFITGAAKSDGVVTANINLIFLDKNDTAIGSACGGSTASTSYVLVSATCTAPTGTVFAEIQLLSTPIGTAGTTWFDVISAYKENLPGIPIITTNLLGQPVVGNPTSGIKTVPSQSDASLQTGADACAQINTNWTVIAANVSALGGVNDARAFSGTPACAANPLSNDTLLGGTLLLGGVQIQAAAPWIAENGILIRGDGAHPVSSPVGTPRGSTIQATSAFPANSTLFTVGSGTANTGSVVLEHMRLSMYPVSGSNPVGGTVYQNLTGQEGTSLHDVFLDGGCAFDFSMGTSQAQNMGTLDGVTAGMNGCNSTSSVNFQFGIAGTSQTIANLSAIQLSGGGTANLAAQVDCTTLDFIVNVWLESGHCENTTVGIEIGANHLAHNIGIVNWGFSASVSKPMLTAIDLASTNNTNILLANISAPPGASITNIVNDASSTNPCTITATTESGLLGWYWRSANSTFTSSTQCPDVWPAHLEDMSASTWKLGASSPTMAGIQGTDTNILSSGVMTGATGTGLCKDANGGATTVSCTSNSIPVAAAVNLTAQNSNIGATTILTPSANGYYRISGWEVSTNTPTGGVVPSVSILFTDADASVAQTVVMLYTAVANAAGVPAQTNSQSLSTAPEWSGTFYAKSGVAIQYETTGYTAGSGTALQYALHLRLEGPF
jgi:hypothetical protein